MKTLKEFYGDIQEKPPTKPKQSVIQRYKALGRRMAQIAKKASTKFKKKRALLRKRDDATLLKSAGKQAKNMIIKKALGPDVDYNKLPIQKRIQINQKIVSKKAKVIQKITKKILRKLKAGEGERVKKNRAALKAKLAQKVTQKENVDESSRLQRAYNDIVKDYSDMVQKGGGKHSNAFYLSRAANNYGIDSIKPIRQYVDSLIKDKKLSKDLTPYNEENESRGYFTRTKSQSSKGKALLRTVKSDLEKVLKGIQHKLEPDSSGNRIIITVNKSDVDKVRKLVGLPNLTKVVSEEVELDEGIKMPDYGKQLKRDAIKLGMKINFKPSGYFLLVGKDSDDFKHHQKIAKKLGMTATNYNKTAGGGSRTELEEDTHGFKCPPDYKFDKKLMACVPKKPRQKTFYAYPSFFGGTKSGDQSGQTQSGNGNGNGNGGNGNGGGNGQ